MEDNKLSPNILAFVGLANEFCVAMGHAHESEKEEFVAEMLRLLPRIYISISDVSISSSEYSEPGFDRFGNYVDEDYYDSLRRNVEMLLGPDDVFLETFEEDMKYSDIPIAASIGESLADIFQDLFNFVSVVKDSEGVQTMDALAECKENFESYWSQTLCNVLRALNNLRYSRDFL